MAAAKKTQKRIKCGYLVTPVGKALWCSAPNPSPFDDTKTEATIIISAEQADIFRQELKDLCGDAAAQLEVDIDEAISNYMKPNTDADGNPTGEFRIKAKTGLQYPPTFADSKGKAFKPAADFTIPNRSEIRLSIGFEVQVVKPTFKGIVARLRGIQVVSLQERGTGFDEVDGDFSAEEATGGASTANDWTTGTTEASGWE